MNSIRFFAATVILMGIFAVIYAAQVVLYNGTDTVDTNKVLLFCVWGLIIFTLGVGLFRVVKK